MNELFVKFTFCWAVEGGNVMMEGFCADILAEAGSMGGRFILIFCQTPWLCRREVARVRWNMDELFVF